MVDSRAFVALAAGLVLVVVTVAMIVGLHCGADGRDDRSASEDSWPDDTEEFDRPEESASEPQTSSEQPETDDDEEPAAGFRELHGIVTDGDNRALPGVEIEVEGNGRLRTISDDDGAYSLHSVPTQAATLMARATGFAETLVEVGRGEPNGDQTIDVSLEDGDGVAGLVLDPNGKAVAGARVGCTADFKQQRDETTDPYGRFELPAASAGCEGLARARGFDDTQRVMLELGTGNLLVLSGLASISGVVVDSSGQPPRSFTIAVESFQPAGGGEANLSYRHTFANPRGSFTVRGLRAGTYVFSLRLPRGEQLRTQAITIKRGERRTGLQLRAE